MHFGLDVQLRILTKSYGLAKLIYQYNQCFEALLFLSTPTEGQYLRRHTVVKKANRIYIQGLFTAVCGSR